MMNFADMLCYADIRQLNNIAQNYDCECGSHSKNELIQSILSRVNRREVIERLIGELTLEELRFIQSLVFEPRNIYSLEELMARAQQTRYPAEDGEGWNPRDTISRFKQKGWLFNGVTGQTKFLLQIPQDLKRRFGESLLRRFEREIVVSDEPDVYRDEQSLLINDIYHFLRFLYHREVPLTSDGFMYKRVLQQLLDSLEVREEPVAKGGWRFGYGRKFKEYPNRFSMIYDYCFFHHYITEDDQKLSLTEQGKAKVLGEAREHPVDVYLFWLKLYKGPIYNIYSLVQWIDKLARRWVTVDSLQRTLCRFIKPYYYDSPESILEMRILQMMMHLGILVFGESDKGKVVRMTPAGSRIIQGIYITDKDAIEIAVDR
jgi:hypothetical protein